MTTTPHGQVPEALIDLIDAYAETRHRCGGINHEGAKKWIDSNFPNHNDPFAYWND